MQQSSINSTTLATQRVYVLRTADLNAQIAANEKGVQELRKMVDHFGLDVVPAYMCHVQDNAEESVRRAVTRLKDGWTTARRFRWRFG